MKVGEGEISAIASYLGVNELEFIQSHTRLRPSRDGLALIDQPDGACIFLQGSDCAIQAVKPKQCTGFPNEWNFPGWQKICRAIAVEED